jgi:phosphatidylglycerophosphate synthase
MPHAMDAVVLASAATHRVSGLTLAERAKRVAARVGAKRVLVVDGDRGGLAAWWRAGRADRLLVIRATDQMVHVPLVRPLVAAPGTAIAVAPEAAEASDLAAGEYAGAFVVAAGAAGDVIEALARGEEDRSIAIGLRATAVPHDAIARHPVRDARERRAAERLLEKILVKPQDNVITRKLYRPVSLPLTRWLARTPITPNQISYVVAALTAIGLWMVAHAEMSMAIGGTAIVLAASYVDCCDGEIARLKLMSSRYGAWLDTIVDEVSSVGYMLAIGWHCHLHFGPDFLGDLGFDPWLAAMAIGLATYLVALYCVYYNIIVVVRSANSQDYAPKIEVVPAEAPNTVRMRPAAVRPFQAPADLPRPLRALLEFMPNIPRRDFICWASLAYAGLHLTHAAFATLFLGGIVTMIVVSIDHLRLRLQRRAIARRGQVLVA